MAGTTGAPDARKSVGAKDAKKAKRFRGQDLTLPDRAREAKDEAAAQELLNKKSRRYTQPGRKGYSVEILETLVELSRKGWNLEKLGGEAGAEFGIPGSSTLYAWRAENPELKEAMEEAYNDFLRDQVMGAIHTVNDYTTVKGLKGWNMVQAMDKQVMRKLQYAGVRLKDWKPEQEGGGDTIVIEVSGGWNPAPVTALPGEPNGQGAEAGAAAARWKAIREGATDA